MLLIFKTKTKIKRAIAVLYTTATCSCLDFSCIMLYNIFVARATCNHMHERTLIKFLASTCLTIMHFEGTWHKRFLIIVTSAGIPHTIVSALNRASRHLYLLLRTRSHTRRRECMPSRPSASTRKMPSILQSWTSNDCTRPSRHWR